MVLLKMMIVNIIMINIVVWSVYEFLLVRRVVRVMLIVFWRLV